MAKIYFDILTLFPTFFQDPLNTSLLAKGQAKGLVEINVGNIRDFGVGKHKQVDDRPFGGGPGMVLKPDVLAESLKTVIERRRHEGLKAKPQVILLDPSGTTFKQEKAQALSEIKWVILVCGHYEGVDERFKEMFVDEEISIGDYVLSGGEVAALVIIESVSRLIPGFLGKQESVSTESFASTSLGGRKGKLLDYPVYTRPENFQGNPVPDILLSGNHNKITTWRLEKSIERTKKRRPDLLT